jgi:flavin-dependent dehydrogenase
VVSTRRPCPLVHGARQVLSHTRRVVGQDAAPEVVVLGSGPAGCTAASLLTRWGHRVVVRTKPPSPASRLAESVPPSTQKLFDLLGLAGALDQAGFVRSTGNTVWWGRRDPRVEVFADGQLGWQITKDRFESMLLAHLASLGVTVEHVVAASAADVCEGSFTVDCTGRAGVLARARGLRIYESSRRIIALTGVWRASQPFRVPDPAHTLIESYEGGWAWSVPETLESRVVAVMVDPGTSGLARGVTPREVYLREIERTSAMAAVVVGASLIEGPAGWDASMYHSTRYADDDVLLVGDAGSFIDPVSSAGVKKALASGWLAAVAIHTSLRRPTMRDIALAFFDEREAEVYGTLRAMTGRVLADAAAGHTHAFWTDRSEADPDAAESAAVSAAFERLRAEPELRVARSPAARIEDRPAASGTEIVLEPRLVSSERSKGIRYAFDVDLVGLVDLAPSYSSVPDLFVAYNQRHAPVSLPDFLGALSTAIAQNWLFWV